MFYRNVWFCLSFKIFSEVRHAFVDPHPQMMTVGHSCTVVSSTPPWTPLWQFSGCRFTAGLGRNLVMMNYGAKRFYFWQFLPKLLVVFSLWDELLQQREWRSPRFLLPWSWFLACPGSWQIKARCWSRCLQGRRREPAFTFSIISLLWYRLY